MPHVLEQQRRETVATDVLGAALARFATQATEAGRQLGGGPGDELERVEALLEGAKRSHQEAVRRHAALA